MKPILLLLTLALCGCESGRRHNESLHRVERWEAVMGQDGHPKSVLVFRETWRDRGALTFSGLFTDPSVAGWNDVATNQTALGGGLRITFGTASSKTDSAGLTAAGGAVGDVIGAAVKTAVKP